MGLRRRILPVVFFFASVLPSCALNLPAAPSTYVNDYAGILSETDRQTLENRLAEFERTTSNQVVVAIFESLEGESLEDFTVRLATAWKVGQKNNDNGVVLAVFLKDRRSRIEVGYGLEGALPDAVCAQILREELGPAFKRGDYAGGIAAAVGAIESATRGEYRAVGRRFPAPPMLAAAVLLVLAVVFYWIAPVPVYLILVALILFAVDELNVPMWFWFVVGPLIMILEWVRQKWIVPRLGYTIHSSRRRGYRGGYWSDFGSGGGWSGGGSGGFGGFSGGGGSFGGGGASGSW